MAKRSRQYSTTLENFALDQTSLDKKQSSRHFTQHACQALYSEKSRAFFQCLSDKGTSFDVLEHMNSTPFFSPQPTVHCIFSQDAVPHLCFFKFHCLSILPRLLLFVSILHKSFCILVYICFLQISRTVQHAFRHSPISNVSGEISRK